MCLIEGCTKKHEAQGYCKVHYNLLVRQGKLKTKQGRGRPKIYTEEQRLEVARNKQRVKYWKKKDYKKGERPKVIRKNTHPSYNMWTNAKVRSKAIGLPFNLDLEDIIIPETCPLLEIPIEKGIGTYTDNSPTLDRIFPHLGYTKGNVWVVSMRANRIKQDASLEELFIICKNLMDKLTTT